MALIPLSLLLLLLACFSTSSSSSLYADHCSSVVPESEATSLFVDSDSSFRISNGNFSGGGGLFRSPHVSNSSSFPYFHFYANYLHKTRSPDVLQVEGTLVLGDGHRTVFHGMTYHHRRPLRNVTLQEEATFHFSGFWSESTGKLCMVGHGIFYKPLRDPLHLSAVLKLNYRKTSNISTSLVSGTVESLGPHHIDPISLVAYAQNEYDFTMIPQANHSCSSLPFQEESLGFGPTSVCSNLLHYMTGRTFQLDYGNGCSGSNCGTLSSSFGFSARFLSFDMIQCSKNGWLHLYIEFSNSSDLSYDIPMVPKKSMVGEGYWDHVKNRLCLIACHILEGSSQASPSVGDCSIGLSLWFPTVVTLRRNDVVGHMWSTKKKSDPGYFSMVSFHRSGGRMVTIPGLRYNYTQMDSVSRSCKVRSGKTQSSEERYPDGRSSHDMRFSIVVEDAGGRSGWGEANVFSIGDVVCGDNDFVMASETGSSAPAADWVAKNHSVWNVSYAISYYMYSASAEVDKQLDIAAEGIYDAGSGTLCMKGCRSPSLPTKNQTTIDCEILINIQFPPLNSKMGDNISGTINTTRSKQDPLYFDPIKLYSQQIYAAEVTEAIWRMDVEIVMFMISLTLSCICIGMQTFHAKKHRDALPSMSITMLGVLILGYVIPLVLNFEALFANRSRSGSLSLRSGGWLDVHEVIVRILSGLALFLSFRLLQMAWSARSLDENKGHRVAEWTTLKLCLPLYFAGALLTWLISSRHHLQRSEFSRQRYGSRWEDLVPYAGLVLDGFLLPQIVLNVCRNSKDKILTPFFYVGMTITRALPHLYDAYRSRSYGRRIDSSYIYASPDRDFYSPVWDVIVPCEGLLFAAAIYLQQRVGGDCLLPQRSRKRVEYEAVPVVAL
ncbi:hypothetical protein C4D60_Mb10t14930 [Musa balbisiana]|uniref:RING-type E3 ubiquitin transferase n=1 Tax=Musa balbisiana TaxID=52838 RepID=A0A4V4H4U8_MUSBA|nr:hypothetical protein C4D60_Mb10t14930 [Musa balbisiana]